MKTTAKYAVLLAGAFVLMVYLIHGGLSAADFKAAFAGIRSDHPLNSIPVTFSGSLDVLPQGRPTANLFSSIVRIAEKFGMKPAGENPGHGSRWQVQIYCRGNYAGNVTTTGDGSVILFQTAPYAFPSAHDYDAFNAELLAALRGYGDLRNIQRRERLEQHELMERGRYLKMDVTAQCGQFVSTHGK